MAKKPATKGGRPKAEIDIAELKKLGALQCTYAEVAAFFDCSKSTIDRRMTEEKYQVAWEAGLAEGQMSLRRTQFKLAKSNTGMAIFLGKNYLGQSDRQTIEGGDKPIMVAPLGKAETARWVARILTMGAKK